MIEPNSSQIGFSRVVTPPSMNGGFSRVNYEMDGFELNGNRKLRKWFRKNAPLSYVGATLLGLVVIDYVTGGKVQEIILPKAKKKII